MVQHEWMSELETAVIVSLPEAEALVGPWRARLDPVASWGVPAHITVIYPFLAPQLVNDHVLAQLREMVAGVSCFCATFRRTAWFGDEVLWLKPEPEGPFRSLTDRVWARFPQCPPYGGVHSDVIPHLTVADGAPLADMRTADQAVTSGLPVQTWVTRALLVQGSQVPDSWRTLQEFPLRT
jgi:hypothetical protein